MNYSRSDEGEATTIRVRGELDALSAPALRPLFDDLVDNRRHDITVDLSELRLVDSSGVGALVSLYKRIRAAGGSVQFSGVTAQPLVIFKLLRLDLVFGLAGDAEENAVEQVEPLPSSVRADS
jgi:anti-sigma B factor antagonist